MYAATIMTPQDIRDALNNKDYTIVNANRDYKSSLSVDKESEKSSWEEILDEAINDKKLRKQLLQDEELNVNYRCGLVKRLIINGKTREARAVLNRVAWPFPCLFQTFDYAGEQGIPASLVYNNIVATIENYKPPVSKQEEDIYGEMDDNLAIYELNDIPHYANDYISELVLLFIEVYHDKIANIQSLKNIKAKVLKAREILDIYIQALKDRKLA